jgi:rhodanese-related sulfurtransferase
MADLSQQEWSKKASEDQNSVILDVRTPEEVAEGMIPNAVNINISDPHGFMDKLGTLDQSVNYFIYCRSGARSAQACAVMNQMGFANTHNLLGGIMEWQGSKV